MLNLRRAPGSGVEGSRACTSIRHPLRRLRDDTSDRQVACQRKRNGICWKVGLAGNYGKSPWSKTRCEVRGEGQMRRWCEV